MRGANCGANCYCYVLAKGLCSSCSIALMRKLEGAGIVSKPSSKMRRFHFNDGRIAECSVIEPAPLFYQLYDDPIDRDGNPVDMDTFIATERATGDMPTFKRRTFMRRRGEYWEGACTHEMLFDCQFCDEVACLDCLQRVKLETDRERKTAVRTCLTCIRNGTRCATYVSA